MWDSQFSHWSLFSPYSRSYSVCLSFSTFFSFLTIIQVKQCLCFIFLDFHSSPHNPVPTVLFLFFRVFTVSRHIRGPTVCVSHIAVFSVFLATFHVLSVCFSFSTSLRVSHDIPSPTVFRSPFPRLSLFSRYSIFLQCGCLIFPIFDFLGIYRS